MTSTEGGGVRASEVLALKVRQWLTEWDEVEFDEREHRRRPEHHFYVFSLSAADLLSLSAIPRRSTQDRALGKPDLGIQRRHEPKRSRDIRSFVQYGYPWSELSGTKRHSERFQDLRKPGWLPTAIVVNILGAGDERRGATVASDDLVAVVDNGSQLATIRMPDRWSRDLGWTPEGLAPIEVIDGQHRLLAFEGAPASLNIDLPVVAFHGLDISWQAYLFWTINIRPKRINPSLAFDLYPLLRTESWLDAAEGHSIYRDTRSQELTEALWAHPESPWHGRINMLGESGQGSVTQSAWVHSLSASYVKAWENRRVPIGGLFGVQLREGQETLPWSRVQQAAFLILVWQLLADAVAASEEEWAQSLREARRSRGKPTPGRDLAFAGPFSLLNTDQGVRAVLQVTNDLCYVRADQLELESWRLELEDGDFGNLEVDEEAITSALKSLRRHRAREFLKQIADALARYDWRTSAFEGLREDQRAVKLGFRGSGGYRELRRQILLHLERMPGDIGRTAHEVREALGY